MICSEVTLQIHKDKFTCVFGGAYKKKAVRFVPGIRLNTKWLKSFVWVQYCNMASTITREESSSMNIPVGFEWMRSWMWRINSFLPSHIFRSLFAFWKLSCVCVCAIPRMSLFTCSFVVIRAVVTVIVNETHWIQAIPFFVLSRSIWRERLFYSQPPINPRMNMCERNVLSRRGKKSFLIKILVCHTTITKDTDFATR